MSRRSRGRGISGVRRAVGRVYRVGNQGGYTGWGTRVGGPGVYPATLLGEARRTATTGSGPSPAGGGWSGSRAGRYWGRRRGRSCPPPGPVLPTLWALPGQDLANAASWPIRRDSAPFLRKLVKTAKCHPKSVERPVIVPIFQKGSRMSPLEILRFPFGRAFSHKELMGLF